MIMLQDNGHRKIIIFAYITLIILVIGLIVGKFRTEVSYIGGTDVLVSEINY